MTDVEKPVKFMLEPGTTTSDLPGQIQVKEVLKWKNQENTKKNPKQTNRYTSMGKLVFYPVLR